MKIIKIITILCIFILSSCNSLYKSLNITDVENIKISRYENYYETEPFSEIYIKDEKDINIIIKYLKLLPVKSRQDKDFHTFDASKISIEIRSKEESATIHIIEDRVETGKYMFYSRVYFWEKKLVSLINSY